MSDMRRASPYHHIAENPDYTGVEFVPEIPSQDYVNPLQLQTCENYEKYGGLYGSQLNMNFISDILPYQSFHRLTDEKLQYRFSDKNKMHAFGYQNGYHIADTSRTVHHTSHNFHKFAIATDLHNPEKVFLGQTQHQYNQDFLQYDGTEKLAWIAT
jgi:hypothetical protein